jgi:DNA relaxase NicK
MRWTREQGGWCTRIDLALDDFTRTLLDLGEVRAAEQAGDFSGFRRSVVTTSKSRQGVKLGESITFGLRGKNGSGRQVQFYDKSLESKGEINSIRLEARFFKEHARIAFDVLADAPTFEEFVGLIGSQIGGSIDFVKREGETHVSRMSRLAWWSRVVDVLGALEYRVRRTVPPLQNSLEYLRDTWSKNLALAWEIAESTGLDADAHLMYLARLMVEEGKRKLDASWCRVGRRNLDLDFVRLLCPS